ncbi:MAG: uncharacterized protein PWQ28_508 [Candidatus Woesearchaeota archaeon]|nr:uncharacterized protein [Candidatus Woesearchaeota archaeon]
MASRDYEILFHRFKRFGEKYLITVDNGAWIFLNKKEFMQLESGILDEELKSKLEKGLIIKTPKNIQEFNDKNYRSHWYRGNGTSLHIMIPTLRCNHTCKYCYAFRKPEEANGYDMNPEIARSATDFVFQTPASSNVIEFSGGEPLLRFDIVKIIINRAQRLKETTGKDIGFALVTNGSLLDDEKFEFLKKNKVGICISFDGPKHIHDYHRKFTKDPNKSTYDVVVSKLEWLKKDKKYPYVFAIPVITKKSLENWKEIVDEYIAQQISVYRFKYLSHFGFASSKDIWGELGYTSEEFIEGWKKTLDYVLSLYKKKIAISENFTINILRKLIGNLDPGFAEMQAPCGAVIGQTVYNYDGSIFPCDEARTLPEFKMGDVRESTYEEKIKHPITYSMASASSLVESCYDCPYYPFCGTCPLETYKMNGCFVTNMPNSYRCKIHTAMFDYIFQKIAEDDEFLNLVRRWANVKQG